MSQATDIGRSRPDDRDAAVVGTAWRAAEDAGRRAGVDVRPVADLADLVAVTALFDAIWRRASAPPITTELLRALARAGNYVAAAFDGPTVVGGCVGFFAPPADGELHSHIAGVATGVRDRHVGLALKLHQRAWVLDHGLSQVTWTFDPLVARNAYFDIAKLAADPTDYLPNFYGDMHDELNGTDDSDRLLVRWGLTAPAVVAACAGTPRRVDATQAGGAGVALAPSSRGGPVIGPMIGSAVGTTVLVGVPPDIEDVRRRDPGLAREWRSALREVLTARLGAGARIVGFDRAGYYILSYPGERPAAPRRDR